MFRVGRAETLWDERRCLELGERRHCGTKGEVQSWESSDIRDKRRSLRIGRAEILGTKGEVLELGEQRHCGTKGGVLELGEQGHCGTKGV